MRDNLKHTIINNIKKNIDIKVLDTLIGTEENTSMEYPRMIFKSYISENEIEVIDYNEYDKKSIEKHPILENVIGLNLLIDGTNNKSKIINYSNGIITLENSLKLNEYISELIISSKDTIPQENEDYVYISSLHDMSKRLNYSLKECYRRFEIGLFVYNDANQEKSSYYMERISSSLDRDFLIYDINGNKIDKAYIFNPIKFDIEENGKTNRVIYGSIMIKVYKE